MTFCPTLVGRGSLLPYDANEAADLLVSKILPGRKPRRAGVCSAAADKRTVQIMDVTISGVPAQHSCKGWLRGSARPSALQDQVTLQGPILRSHLQDDREPRLTKVRLPGYLHSIPPGTPDFIAFSHTVHIRFIQTIHNPDRSESPTVWSQIAQTLVKPTFEAIEVESHIHLSSHSGSGLSAETELPVTASKLEIDGPDLQPTQIGMSRSGHRKITLNWETAGVLDRSIIIAKQRISARSKGTCSVGARSPQRGRHESTVPTASASQARQRSIFYP